MCRSDSDSETLLKLRSCEVNDWKTLVSCLSSNRHSTLLTVGVFETRSPGIFGLHGRRWKGRIRARKNAMCARGRRRVFILLLLARFPRRLILYRLRAILEPILEPSAVSGKVKLCKLMVKRRGDWGFRPRSSRLRRSLLTRALNLLWLKSKIRDCSQSTFSTTGLFHFHEPFLASS